MKKTTIFRILDLIPLAILLLFAVNLLIVIANTNIVLQKVHYAGLSLVLVTTILVFINHKLGVICLGVTILTGLIGFASVNAYVSTSYVGVGSFKIHFSLEFLIWAIIHAIISGRYYVGIATAEYWDKIFDKGSSEPLKIDN